MKFQIKNLGAITQAEFELGDLTIICGKNNTGKTYAAYVVYDFLQSWKRLIDFHIADHIFHELYEKDVVKVDLTPIERQLPQIIAELSDKFTRVMPLIR